MSDAIDTRVSSTRSFQLTAAGFYQCAQLAHQAIVQQGIPKNQVLWIGMHQNLLQAYELSAKAYLSSKGVPETELRGSARHNISELNQKCFEQGIISDADLKGITGLEEAMKKIEALLGGYYKTHQFRYMSGPELAILSDSEAVRVCLLVVEKIFELSGFEWE